MKFKLSWQVNQHFKECWPLYASGALYLAIGYVLGVMLRGGFQ